MRKIISVLLALSIILTMNINSLYALAKDAYSDNSIKRACLHDPSIIRANNGSYYAVGSHLAMIKSNDLINWNNLDSSINGKNYLTVDGKSWKENLEEPLKWTTDYQNAVILETGIEKPLEYNCWANDIIYNETMKKYCLYGCCSVWGTTASVIWLAVSDDIEGPYKYVDSFIYSNVSSNAKALDSDFRSPRTEANDYSKTNMKDLIAEGYMDESLINSRCEGGYPFTDYNGYYRCGWGEYPNAIDPNAFIDSFGEMWLVYGSYSGGCFVVKLDNKTGLPDYSYMKRNSDFDIYFGKRISNTNPETEATGEGPFIIYDKQSKYYYLFLTYGGLAASDGYNIREYRSKRPDGPYEDAAGNLATDFKNTGLKISANFQFDSMKSAYLSPGHSSCLIDADGRMFQMF
ncbi:MAG: family 43 glycosylhydrolase, partial [Eubacterium sp.]|nr:family 43 glycosylhydrolase [Eubacterium sp.]